MGPRRQISRRLCAAALLFLALLSDGCVSHTVARRMVTPPNLRALPRMLRDPRMLAAADAAWAHAWKLKVGPPAAELAVGIIEPADYRLTWRIQETRRDEHHGDLSVSLDWHLPIANGKLVLPDREPKGTIVLLHGLMMPKESMMPWAFFFAERGYRAVLVDLRGHGRSTGEWLGYGTWEAADLVQVTDELQRRGLLAGRLGVFGESYGAAIALQWAARDPRVATAIVLAPFTDARTALPDFARGFDPKVAGKLSDATFAAAARGAERIAGFSWDAVSVLAAVKRLRIPVLFFHGAADTWIPPLNSQQLMTVAPPGSRRRLTPHDDHTSLGFRFDLLGAPALAWFENQLSPWGAAPADTRTAALFEAAVSR